MMTDQFIHFWQHIPENITPYLFKVGGFELRYYGLMYIAAFLTVYLLSIYRLRTEGFRYSKIDIENYFTWAILGLILGARFGYVLFYNFSYYLSHPLEIILPFSFDGGMHFTGLAGMSYHGGLIGVVTASQIYCKRNNFSIWNLSELIVPAIPLGYTFGRIGNFINGELFGKVTTGAWGMYFPHDATGQLRHPSQLYEAFFEGIFLFVILWFIRKRRIFDGFYLALYLIGYGTVRFFIEFVREPDSHLGYYFNFLTMGQILCLCMMLAGFILMQLRKGKSLK